MNTKIVVAGCAALMFAMFAATPRAVAEEVVTIDQTPAAVKAAIEKAVAGGTIKKIEKEIEDGKTIYEVEFVKDGKKQEAEFTEDGSPAGEDDDDKDGEAHDEEDKD